jgi:ureidoacrylate peracid hydrolase
VLSKRRYSAFFQTDLDLWLREHDVARVVVTGVALNICVRSTVHDAFFLGYQVWVVQDACRATGEREEASTLYDIQTHFGEVVTVEDVLEAWA